jgi:uncharacterized OsmC-like protein/alpha/beta superfamily hydrolase
MPEKSIKFEFQNSQKQTLAGKLELPEPTPQAFALFAHCFTCSKDVAAASRISRNLRSLGVAVLRFDFTGLGNSEGDFANTNFSSNVDDLIKAAQALEEQYQAPKILIGHSLGGAAALYAASEMKSLKVVATIGAPSDVAHVSNLFEESLDKIIKAGEADVLLAGRKFKIKNQFIEDINEVNLKERLSKMRVPLLIFHSPQDDTVSIEHAKNIYSWSKHPKSFITLDGADHLLNNKIDSEYVAEVLKSWSSRYMNELRYFQEEKRPQLAQGQVQVNNKQNHLFLHDLWTPNHHAFADEPQSVGGDNIGPTPYQLLLQALGGCTSMTMKMYAQRKGINLTKSKVTLSMKKIHAKDCEDCESKEGLVDEITKKIEIEGDFSDEQKKRILEIAERCPVNKTLLNEVKIRSEH